MTKSEAAKRCRELAIEVMEPWKELHKMLLEIDGNHNRLFNSGCAVKSPSLEVHDAFIQIAKGLEAETPAPSGDERGS